MNFANFIRTIRTNKKSASTKEFFESLGGEEKLGISLRYFQQIESGDRVPSEKILAQLFNQMRPSDRKALVVSFFRSVYGNNKDGAAIISYLEKYLSPDIESEKSSIWNSNRKFMTYSEEQLDFFINNPDAMRFHKAVLLYGGVPADECMLTQEKLNSLESLNLIQIKDGEILPSRELYRTPHYETSSPKAVAKASDFILKHIDIFISREGSENQELGYAIQMVTPDAANRIFEQLRVFKQWVQSLASDQGGPDEVPLIFVGFGKKLNKRDLK